MNGSSLRLSATALGVGLLLVPVRVVVMFFPLFNLGEVILFGGAAALVAIRFRAAPSLWCALLVLPTFLHVLHIVVSWLGLESLRQGIGGGHVVSLMLIPVSAFAGAYYGGRLARRHSLAQ